MAVPFLPHFARAFACEQAPAPGSIVDVLREEFDRRRRANARYSLRAFAGALRLDSGTLSQALAGRRTFSAGVAKRLFALLRDDGPAADATVNETLRRSHERRVLRQIALAACAPGSRRFARRLKLGADDVNAAVTRLLRDGRVQMISSTCWRVADAQGEDRG